MKTHCSVKEIWKATWKKDLWHYRIESKKKVHWKGGYDCQKYNPCAVMNFYYPHSATYAEVRKAIYQHIATL